MEKEALAYGGDTELWIESTKQLADLYAQTNQYSFAEETLRSSINLARQLGKENPVEAHEFSRAMYMH